MIWSILILTQPSRQQFLARLQAVLKPQIEEHSDIEVLVRTFDRQLDLGTNRQRLIDSASGRYNNFVDDDDLIATDYVSTIYPLLDGVDYVGFQLQMYIDGVPQKPTYHSLRYAVWNGDDQGWYRDISHLNPIRRELAVKASMSGGGGEDQRWADKLRELGVVKTEHYVDKILYYYFWRSTKTDNPADQVASTTNRFNLQNEQRRTCPKCGSTATGMAGGMRQCNQCGERFG